MVDQARFRGHLPPPFSRSISYRLILPLLSTPDHLFTPCPLPCTRPPARSREGSHGTQRNPFPQLTSLVLQRVQSLSTLRHARDVLMHDADRVVDLLLDIVDLASAAVPSKRPPRSEGRGMAPLRSDETCCSPSCSLGLGLAGRFLIRRPVPLGSWRGCTGRMARRTCV